MHFSLQFLALITLPSYTFAFQSSCPTFINPSQAYQVSSIEDTPLNFEARVNSNSKQAVLLSTNSTSSLTSSSISSSVSSSSSSVVTKVQLESGFSFIQADSANEAYQVNITINSIEYPLLIDTGSPYLWIYGANCTDAACEDKLLFSYDNHDSATTFSLAYTVGSASGKIGTENVIVAGLEASDFAFGIADTVPDIFDPYSFSGVLGLPASDTSSTGMVNLVSGLKDDDKITIAKFILCLGEYSTTTEEENAGLFIIGNDVDDLYDGKIYYTDILQNSGSYWKVKIDNFFIDGYQVSFDSMKIENVTTSTSRIGLIDSGTTSLITTKADAIKIHSYFENSVTDGENYAILCNSTLTLDFEIQGHNWTLTSVDYIGQAYSQGSGYDGYCVSNIQGLDSTTDGSWILGALFLKNYYLSFDIQNSQVGFAERNDNVEIVRYSSNSTATDPSGLITVTHSSGQSSSTRASNSSSSTTFSSSSSTTSTNNAAVRDNTAGSLLTPALALALAFLF